MSLFDSLRRKSARCKRKHCFGLLALCVSALIPVSNAHHPVFDPQLSGVSICVDEESIRTEVAGPQGVDLQAADDLRQRIRSSFELESARGERAFYLRPNCPPEAQQLRLQASARYLNPENYIGFPDSSYSFRANLHVGDLEKIESPATTATSDLPFAWTAGGVHSESTTELAVIEHVSLASAAGLERLTDEWLEQNPELGLRYWIVAFAVLASVTVLVSIATTTRTRSADTEGGED